MRYCAHQARLNAPDQNGVAYRVHLEGRVRRALLAGRGPDATLVAELEGPELPEALAYLWERFQRLNGMRGVAMHGLAPFTPESIDAANRLFQWQLTPLEVEGLTSLDGAYRHPESMQDEEEDAPGATVVQTPAWPSPKATGRPS